MKTLKCGLITVQSINLGALIAIDVMLMVLQQPNLDSDVT
jgi:hypothetical protein